MISALGSLFIPIAVLAAAIIMICCEQAVPGRSFPKVAGWYARSLFLNVVQAAVIVLAGMTWDGWLKAHRLWDADDLGVTGSAILGYVVLTFVYYWWHRWRHEVGFLWRWLHQVHHSPQRLTVITSFYKHPFELLSNGVLSSLVLYTVCGVGPQAAGYAMLISGVAELFYHWNVQTPAWLGPIFQRPENHCVHHQEGVHGYNYSDLPIWDILFGTYKNEPVFTATCGFGDVNEHRLPEMLKGIDVVAVPAKVAS